VYVANSGSDSVSVFDGVTGSYVASITVGTYPQAIAVNPMTNTVYIVNSDSSNVAVIDGATNLFTNTVTVSDSPVAVAVNPITRRSAPDFGQLPMLQQNPSFAEQFEV
jgi:YVTN family beta-propeller protein